MKKIITLLIMMMVFMSSFLSIFAVTQETYLKSLSVDSGTLSPVFSPNVTFYAVIMDKSADNFKFKLDTDEKDAIVEINGVQVENGYTAPIPLESGFSQFDIIVRSADYTRSKLYTVMVGAKSETVINQIPPKIATLPDIKMPSGVGVDYSNHWAKKYISALYALKIVNGYPDGNFKPDNYINRSEVVALIINALKIKQSDVFCVKYKDDKNIPDWAKNYVQIAYSRQIIRGYEDNTFRPFNNVTRAEMITMVLRGFNLNSQTGKTVFFSDDPDIPKWAKPNISEAFEVGILNGYSDNSIRAQNYITRGEASAIVYNCMIKYYS